MFQVSLNRGGALNLLRLAMGIFCEACIECRNGHHLNTGWSLRLGLMCKLDSADGAVVVQ